MKTNKEDFERLMTRLRKESTVQRAMAKKSGQELLNRIWRVSTG